MVLGQLSWQGGGAGSPPAPQSSAALGVGGCRGSSEQVSPNPCVWDKLGSISTQMGHPPTVREMCKIFPSFEKLEVVCSRLRLLRCCCTGRQRVCRP